jgi:hypothetical protein
MDKRVYFLFFLFTVSQSAISQNLKVDDNFRHIIGNTFKVDTDPQGLGEYTYVGGSVLSPLEVENMVVITEYRYQQNVLITFSRKNNPANELFTIEEVLHIKNLKNGWDLKTAVCRKDTEDDPSIIAIVKAGNKEFSDNVKMAWRFNWQTLTLEKITVKGIDCLHEGFDLTSL